MSHIRKRRPCEKEVFLVLSATTKYKDLINIADAYKEMVSAVKRATFFLSSTWNLEAILAIVVVLPTPVGPTKKTTLTPFSLGNLLNLKLYTGAALSYVTHGQNVPDDIENFNPQKTVKRLLGGKS